ncbi:hypothetical protein T492DRAFT_864357 [Pavlovales sp. CCMP2436]|nr:hypothetical protein T492DRAFT_864357 [Pavlovales sp. CCMP2436]
MGVSPMEAAARIKKQLIDTIAKEMDELRAERDRTLAVAATSAVEARTLRDELEVVSGQLGTADFVTPLGTAVPLRTQLVGDAEGESKATAPVLNPLARSARGIVSSDVRREAKSYAGKRAA